MAKTVENDVASSDKIVTIRIPRDRNEAEDKVVWVNERRFLIQRGVAVDVPESVAEILQHEEDALQLIYDYEESVQR